MGGFNDILNPAPRASGRSAGSVNGGSGGAPASTEHPRSQQQLQQQPRRPSLSPANSYEDAHYASHQAHQHSTSYHQQRPGSASSRRSNPASEMSVDVAQANANANASSTRPSYISMPSPSAGAGASRTSISSLLGDSVESPRSRLIPSGASSPADENRRSLHPPWPPGAPHSSGSAPDSAGAGSGHGMSHLLNHGTPGAVVERKNSRSASTSSQGPAPGAVSASYLHQQHVGAGMAGAPGGPVPGSPSGSTSEASTAGGLSGGAGTTPGGRTLVNRLMGFFRKDGAASPQQHPAIPPHQAHANASAGQPLPSMPPGSSGSRLGYNRSPSGGSTLPLPLTPGTSHPSADSHAFPLHQQHPYPHAHSAHVPPPSHSAGGSADYSRRPLPPASYVDGVEYSPTLAVHHAYPQHGAHPVAHPHQHQQLLESDRASLSPTAIVQGLPAEAFYSADQSHSRMAASRSQPAIPPPLPVAAGSDMSPPPIPASISRTAGTAAKRSASNSGHAEGAPEAGAAGAIMAAPSSKRRSRGAGAANRDSTTPASSRPASPTDSISQPGLAAAPAQGDGAAPPATAASSSEFRDPKVNVSRLPPPKFAKPTNLVSPGANAATGGVVDASALFSGSGAKTLGGIENPSSRTPGAPKDWMSSGMISAAVGLATGLDGGAAAAAAAASAAAAIKVKEQEEKEKERAKARAKERSSAVEDGTAGEVKSVSSSARRKSSSAASKRALDASASEEAKRPGDRVAAGNADARAGSASSTTPGRASAAKKKRENSVSGGVQQASAVAVNGDEMELDPDQGDAGPLASPSAGRVRTGSGALPPDANPYAFVPKQRTASTSSAASAYPSQRRPTAEYAAMPPIKTVSDPIPYQPTRRRTAPTTIKRPIYAHEIEELKTQHRNPLRWKYEEEMAGLISKTGPEGNGPAQVKAEGNGNGHGASMPPRPTSSSDALIPPSKRKREGNGHGGDATGAARGPADLEPAAKRRAASGGGVAAIAKGPDNNEVSEHYNSRKDVGVVARKDSKIYPLKKFNNWAKNLLIQRFSHDGCRVLDMGCGKGGDLNKWARARASALVMIDIAGMSVGQAQNRYMEQRHDFDAEFFTFDCFSRPLVDVVPAATLAPKFDTVTLQFCMHYGWETVSKARCLLENVSRYLRPGGFFIGTIPDADNLMQRVRALKGNELEFGNEYYRVSFEQKERNPPFGNKYSFFLEDAVDDVPEYVVEWDEFVKLAREFGLKLVYRRTFAQMFHDAASAGPKSSRADQEARQDLPRMGVKVPRFEGDIPMQKDLWEAVCLYLGFAFERIAD